MPQVQEFSQRSPSGAAHLFHRPALASSMAAQLMSESFKSGLFLTGPRRTGKTTFVRGELAAALRDEEALPSAATRAKVKREEFLAVTAA